jgi:hypothetical protein
VKNDGGIKGWKEMERGNFIRRSEEEERRKRMK